MSEFDTELRELAGRLELPEPSRSRMLLELRWDLESMATELRARGIGEAESRERAVRALVPSPDAVSELGVVHRPLYERWVARLSAPGRHRLERVLAVGIGVLYLATGIAALWRFELLATPSPFLWPVLVLAVVVATASVTKLFQLVVVGVQGRRSRRGLRLLLVLGVLTPLVALGGGAADLYLLAGELQADVGPQVPAVLTWLRSTVVLGSVALLTASGAGLAWLLASVWIARIEQREAAALGGDQSFQEERSP